jgi:NADP-dependent 3-hydroxy acid dehydrogenase YdfG
LARKKNAGMFICTKAVLPGMIERKYGKIVNLYLVSLSIRTSAILAYTGWLQVYLK